MLVKENLYNNGLKKGFGKADSGGYFDDLIKGKLIVQNYTDYYTHFLISPLPIADISKTYVVGFVGDFTEVDKLELYVTDSQYYEALIIKENFAYQIRDNIEKWLPWHIRLEGKAILESAFIVEGDTLPDSFLVNRNKLNEQNKKYYKTGNFKEIVSI